MDTSRLNDFVDMVDTNYHTAKVFGIIKRIGIDEYRKDVRQKEKAFEQCVIEFYLEYGNNTDRALGIYYDKLIHGYKILYRQIMKLPPLYLGDSNTRQLCYFYTYLIDYSLKAIKYISKILKTNYRQDIQDKRKIDGFINDTPQQNKQNEPLNKNRACAMHDADLQKETDASSSATNVFYTTNYTNKQLKRVYKYLIENGHLEADNLLSDFIYFFTGRGKKVNNCLKWSSERGAKVNLAFFLIAITGGERKTKIWKKAKVIFNKTGLAQSFNEAPEASIYERKISQDVLDLLK